MIYPNKPLYLLSLLGYIYYLTYYTLTTKDNIKYSLLCFFPENMSCEGKTLRVDCTAAGHMIHCAHSLVEL